MYPEPRELTNAAEVIANRREVRERLRSLPAWTDSKPVQTAPAVIEPHPMAAAPEPLPPPPAIEIAAQPETIAAPASPTEPLSPPPKPGFSRAPRIRDMVAAHYGLTREEITSHNRSTPYLLPRYVAMYLCIRYAGMSSPAVGLWFGGRDHSTVITAVRKARARIESDAQCAADVAEFVRQIEAWG